MPRRPTRYLVYKAIWDYYVEHQVGPSVRDIMALSGITSTSVIDRHVKELKDAGVLHHGGAYRARSLYPTCFQGALRSYVAAKKMIPMHHRIIAATPDTLKEKGVI